MQAEGSHPCLAVPSESARPDGVAFLSAAYIFNVPRSELPALVTVDLALPTDCPAPTNQPLVVNTTCGAGNDMFGGVGCGYRFPGGECPRQCPAKACSADADCAADATHDGCRGPPMRAPAAPQPPGSLRWRPLRSPWC